MSCSRKAVGPGEDLVPSACGLGYRFVHQAQTLVESAVEPLLLALGDSQDALPALTQLRVGAAHHLHDPLGEEAQERGLDAHRTAEAGSAPDDPPEHVAPSLVAGIDSVRDQEGHGPGVVGQHAQGDVGLRRHRRSAFRTAPRPVRSGA